ncbi:hypothetical protein CRG98_013762 [Punica granatum]|uniref:Uncharacterized protein n=1 Tax=Punica granatum TaxID=22663 RepID=A0A2I0KBF8_PUNGR|nr:hypothetical protein CRG98_013762 [Punica granatum]
MYSASIVDKAMHFSSLDYHEIAPPAKVIKPWCAHPNLISSGHACTRLCNAAWECPSSRGRATDAREKESPLPVYDPKVESR